MKLIDVHHVGKSHYVYITDGDVGTSVKLTDDEAERLRALLGSSLQDKDTGGNNGKGSMSDMQRFF